jgi:hypothetical protein
MSRIREIRIEVRCLLRAGRVSSQRRFVPPEDAADLAVPGSNPESRIPNPSP